MSYNQRVKRASKTWDESNYDPSNQDEEDEEMEEDTFEVEEFEEEEAELGEGEDEDIDMAVSEAEVGGTEEEVEEEDISRRENDQIETYEVESIIQRKFENGREMFQVRWKGYTKTTWEPRENLDNCTEALDNFYRLVKDANFDSKSEDDSKHEKWKISINDAYETSKKFDYEVYEKYILRRGLIEVGEGYKVESVPFSNHASRQNSSSSSKGQ